MSESTPSEPATDMHVCLLCGQLFKGDPGSSGGGFCPNCSKGAGEPPPDSETGMGLAGRLRAAILKDIEKSADDQPVSVAARPGEVLHGRYKVLYEIETTRLSQVYLAFDAQLSRKIVLKYVNFKRRRDHVERFRRESQLLASLKHPNIVAVYDSGIQDDRPYMVMEYVEGIDLARFNEGLMKGKDERNRLRRVLEIVYEVCNALDYLHRQGIVHRDIKPQNIMLDRLGCPYLIDFGIAKQPGEEGSEASSRRIMGTLGYMSPEQTRGGDLDIDARSDIYSIGILLYELLSGSKPFNASSPDELVEEVRSRTPAPPSKLNPKVSAGMDAIVLKALSKKKDDRYASAKEVALQLEPFVMGAGAEVVGGIRFGWYRRNRMMLAAGLNAVALLVAGIMLFPEWIFQGETLAPGATRFRIQEDFSTPESVQAFEVDSGGVALRRGRLAIEQGRAVFGGTAAPSDELDYQFTLNPETAEEIRIGVLVQPGDSERRGTFLILRPVKMEGAWKSAGQTVATFRLSGWAGKPVRVNVRKRGTALGVALDGVPHVSLPLAFQGVDTEGRFSIRVIGGSATMDDLILEARRPEE